MNRTRTVGLALAAVAALLWLLFLVAVLTGDPDDGADIGAGLVALLALPVSAGASITLLVSLRTGRPGGSRTPDRVAAALAVLSIACLAAFLLLDPYATSDVLRQVSLGLGVAAFLASSAIIAVASRSRV
ncbi:hypothetical protein [Blastococcus tunisiensis]|uniref:Uncharacterized protein n=1 Tax=Blastococcus tunisiensis TaxID=1798228 RepID=A0A1I2LS00_9ACTN|nr:hypothetical protein [Blastococcus sp. DSM 46838]SFF82232.1 hypothetical protein SAMN05216574_12831 [Blastococcus sp. DSM 46838]